MNSKEAKRYRKKAKALTVDWIKSLIPDEEGTKVNIDNFQDYMPDQKYVYANKKFMDRFTKLLDLFAKKSIDMKNANMEQLNDAWEEVKKSEVDL